MTRFSFGPTPSGILLSYFSGWFQDECHELVLDGARLTFSLISALSPAYQLVILSSSTPSIATATTNRQYSVPNSRSDSPLCSTRQVNLHRPLQSPYYIPTSASHSQRSHRPSGSAASPPRRGGDVFSACTGHTPSHFAVSYAVRRIRTKRWILCSCDAICSPAPACE